MKPGDSILFRGRLISVAEGGVSALIETPYGRQYAPLKRSEIFGVAGVEALPCRIGDSVRVVGMAGECCLIGADGDRAWVRGAGGGRFEVPLSKVLPGVIHHR